MIEEGQVEISMAVALGPSLPGEEDVPARDKVPVAPGPGHMFGQMAFIFGHEASSAAMTAVTDGGRLSISGGDFKKFSERGIDCAYRIAHDIARVIAMSLGKTDEDMKKLTRAPSIALRRPRREQ